MVKPDCTWGTCLLIIFLIFFQCNRIDAIYRNRLNLATQFLAPHNEARAALGMHPLVWDWRVARYAAWYANQRRGDCALRHSNGPYGENIFWAVVAVGPRRRWLGPGLRRGSGTSIEPIRVRGDRSVGTTPRSFGAAQGGWGAPW
ncbi:hypothetical protein MRB53_008912 [Persea americana]|uniref:Uncharacterized protein n=1 Tax=Persea americana TaxID=3435 RepID=A0ACC2LMP0_PERAE|nr:hypothetical protein MRB53_008912 [Persea americana]